MRRKKEIYEIPEIKVIRFTDEIVFASGCDPDCQPDCQPDCDPDCLPDCFST